MIHPSIIKIWWSPLTVLVEYTLKYRLKQMGELASVSDFCPNSVGKAHNETLAENIIHYGKTKDGHIHF
jgi:hypothetical protein